jgi:hypothetical protein
MSTDRDIKGSRSIEQRGGNSRSSTHKLIQARGDLAPIEVQKSSRRLHESTKMLSTGITVYFRWLFGWPSRIVRFLSGLANENGSKPASYRSETPKTEATEPCESIDSDSDDQIGKPSPCISTSVGQRQAWEAETVQRAEKSAVDSEHEDCVTTLTFTIKLHVEYGQCVFVVGSVRELGNWDPDQAIALQWSEGDVWTGSATVKRSQLSRIEYKYFVRSGSEAKWEAGGNHNILKKASNRIALVDVWEFPGYIL